MVSWSRASASINTWSRPRRPSSVRPSRRPSRRRCRCRLLSVPPPRLVHLIIIFMSRRVAYVGWGMLRHAHHEFVPFLRHELASINICIHIYIYIYIPPPKKKEELSMNQ